MMRAFSVQGKSSQYIMAQVLIALLPVLAYLSIQSGALVIIQLFYTSASALLAEALMLYLGKKPLKTLLDGSALITAWLLAISLPLGSSFWLCASASAFAIIIAKQLYGGLGFNLFNPAMAGFAFVLISFPEAFHYWPDLDGTTGASALTLLKQNQGLTLAQLSLPSHNAFALSCLLGGLYLWLRGVFSWHTPVAFMLAISLLSLGFYQGGGSLSGGSPWLNLSAGGTMLAAFFIITDPCTSAASAKGKLIYGALAGALVYGLRHGSSFNDSIAFAVLLANFAVPLIDKLCLWGSRR